MKKLVEILKELEKDKRPATAKQVSFVNLMLEGKVEEAKQKANELCKKEKLYVEVVA